MTSGSTSPAWESCLMVGRSSPTTTRLTPIHCSASSCSCRPSMPPNLLRVCQHNSDLVLIESIDMEISPDGKWGWTGETWIPLEKNADHRQLRDVLPPPPPPNVIGFDTGASWIELEKLNNQDSILERPIPEPWQTLIKLTIFTSVLTVSILVILWPYLGPSHDYSIEVIMAEGQCWSGSVGIDVGSKSVEGCGDAVIELGTGCDIAVVGVIQKQFDESGDNAAIGPLGVAIYEDDQLVAFERTDAQYGVVSVSHSC
jgi:hypothetical protein